MVPVSLTDGAAVSPPAPSVIALPTVVATPSSIEIALTVSPVCRCRPVTRIRWSRCRAALLVSAGNVSVPIEPLGVVPPGSDQLVASDQLELPTESAPPT